MAFVVFAHCVTCQAFHAVPKLACARALVVRAREPGRAFSNRLAVKEVDNNRVVAISVLLPDEIGRGNLWHMREPSFARPGVRDCCRRIADKIEAVVEGIQQAKQTFVRVLLRRISILRRYAAERVLSITER